MSLRSFIGIPLPQDATNELGDIAAKMAYQDKSNAVKWVDQANYHITLAFLGEQSMQDLESLADQLDYSLQQVSFQASVKHLSPFPEGKPKLIGAMIDRNDSLRELHQQVMSAVNASVIEIDKRRFIPHITLGRYRHTRNSFSGAIPMNVACEFILDDVVLYESNLTPSGAEYETVFRFPLDDYYSDDETDYQSDDKANSY